MPREGVEQSVPSPWTLIWTWQGENSSNRGECEMHGGRDIRKDVNEVYRHFKPRKVTSHSTFYPRPRTECARRSKLAITELYMLTHHDAALEQIECLLGQCRRRRLSGARRHRDLFMYVHLPEYTPAPTRGFLSSEAQPIKIIFILPDEDKENNKLQDSYLSTKLLWFLNSL